MQGTTTLRFLESACVVILSTLVCYRHLSAIVTQNYNNVGFRLSTDLRHVVFVSQKQQYALAQLT